MSVVSIASAPPVSSVAVAESLSHTQSVAQVVSSVEGLSSIRDEWLRATVDGRITSPNCHPDRYAVGLSTLETPGRPHVVVLRGGAGPDSVIVGRTTTRQLECRVGYRSIPTPTLQRLEVLHGGAGVDPAHAATAAQLLLGRVGAFDLITVHWIRRDHALTDALIAAAGDAGRPVVVTPPSKHHALDIVPGDADATLASLSRKRRYQLRREERLLREAFDVTVDVEELSQSTDVPTAIARMSAITNTSYKQAIGAGVRDTPRWHALLTQAASSGWMRAWFLMAGETPIAYVLGTVVEDQCTIECMGYEPAYARLSPGKMLLHQVIRGLASRGQVRRVDYGLGDATYKRVLGSASHADVTLHLFGRSLRARATRLEHAGVTAAARGLRRVVGGDGAVQRIRRLWRERIRPTDGGTS